MKLSKLKAMAVFAAVVDCGSFNKAAKLLGISRPAVSEQIKKLEQLLSVRLLQRTTRNLSLTQEGEKILPLAQSVLESLDLVSHVLTEDEPKGVIRITATYDFTSQWLLPKLSAFSRIYPKVQFDLVISDERLNMISERIDIALRAANIEEDGFVARPIFNDRLQLYASPTYLDSLSKPVSIDNLEQQTWILLDQLMPNNELTIENDLDKHHCKPAHFDKVNSPGIMNELILSGRGVGCLIDHIARDNVKNGKLIKLLPDWHSRSLTFFLLYPSRQHLPKRVRLLIDFLLQFPSAIDSDTHIESP
ncbi:MAG: DNA-binding transcriptional LysR family regulator [Shewanella sp.]|jgi:DNA-binding transcriptional LysR family regulator